MNLKQRIRFAVYAFKHGLVPSGGLSMKVHSFQKSGPTSEALGITDERKSELTKLATDLYQKHRYFTEGLSEASEACNHPNELVQVVVVFEQCRFLNRHPLLGMAAQFFGK